MISIVQAHTNFENEPLLHPFGFKGGAMKHIWQYAVHLKTAEGLEATGVGCQGVLWSDAAVFAGNSPSAGCAMMYLITEFAAKALLGRAFPTPAEAIEAILPETTAYAQAVTGRKELRRTFVLNALVGLDQALWKLYELQTGGRGFDAIVPAPAREALSYRYGRIGIIPLISYGVTREEVRSLAADGYFLLKIKIGSDPDKDGDYEKMLAWDQRRLEEVHRAVKEFRTPYTESGHIAYYLDANGRYDSKERLMRLLEYARGIGVLERTILLEEPFPEEYKCDVSDIPVLVAADESAHSQQDVRERLALGYRAIALKPIAKTISVTFGMIEAAREAGAHCFCADLTVGPLQVEVNKCFAARLNCLPGLKLPVFETNGWQNYANWAKMEAYHPACGAPWTLQEGGGYALDNGFYEQSGGIFREYPHYRALALEG